MLNTLRVRPHIRARIQGGPLGRCADDFVTALRRQGYAPAGVRRSIHAVDVFGQWLARRGIAASAVDEATVARFTDALGRRQPPSRAWGRPPEIASGVRTLAAFLWDTGVAHRRTLTPPDTGAERCLRDFDAYLGGVRGLASGTRAIYLRYARAFLAARGGCGEPDRSVVTAEAIVDFVRTQAAALTPAACRAPATALRAWVRFLVSTGAVRAGLEAAVPVVREWKHAALPRFLTPTELRRVLTTRDERRPAAVRDRAVVLLLARLGLRAAEIAALRLEDIDWREGCVLIRAGKSDRARRLPLPQDVGAALVRYVRGCRWARGGGTIFRSAHPPHGPLAAVTVTTIAQAALRRAGITVARAGAHTFRHTAATHMVRGGASFKAVADVLGHASLETTAIYAKLDLATLAGVALPWPGVDRESR